MSAMRWVLCPHYGAQLLERHCLKPLGISADRTLDRLGRRYGHLGASDQVVALHHLQQHGPAEPGDYVLLLGIGVGMTWTAAIVRFRGDVAGTDLL
jgi:3-oxoacyl-[acyl-carrier-protein] synthase-3